jgi:hypothetical protein
LKAITPELSQRAQALQCRRYRCPISTDQIHRTEISAFVRRRTRVREVPFRLTSHRGPVVLVIAPARSIVASQVVEILAFQITEARADTERLLQYTRVRLIVHVQRVPRVRIVVTIAFLEHDPSETLTLQASIIVADVRRRTARVEPLLDDARAIPVVISIAIARAHRLRVVATEESVGGDALRLRCAHAPNGQFTRAG